MIDLKKRRAFADFLDRLASEPFCGDDWSKHVVSHYHDEVLETFRRNAPDWPLMRAMLFRQPLRNVRNFVPGHLNSARWTGHNKSGRERRWRALHEALVN